MCPVKPSWRVTLAEAVIMFGVAVRLDKGKVNVYERVRGFPLCFEAILMFCETVVTVE